MANPHDGSDPKAAVLLPDDDLEQPLLGFAHGVRKDATRILAPHARDVDEREVFRRETVREMADAGWLRGPLPETLGGGGWSAMQLAVAHEEIGAVCGNGRGFLAVQCGLVAHTLAHRGSKEQQQRWLPGLLDGSHIGCFGLTEPGAGSDVASLATEARPDGDGWTLHGTKWWITNGGVADVALVFANADPAQGKAGITGFVVPTERAGLKRTPMEGVPLGHRGSDHAQLEFDGVRVERSDVLGGPDAIGQGFDTAMSGLGAGRLSVAAGAVGIHRAALRCAVDHVRERVQFGRPLAKFQMVQERIADAALELLAARQLVYRCARRRDAGKERTEDLAAAKLFATDAASRAAESALMLLGGRGYTSAYPAERLLRDSYGLRIYEGTSMVQKAILARCVL